MSYNNHKEDKPFIITKNDTKYKLIIDFVMVGMDYDLTTKKYNPFVALYFTDVSDVKAFAYKKYPQVPQTTKYGAGGFRNDDEFCNKNKLLILCPKAKKEGKKFNYIFVLNNFVKYGIQNQFQFFKNFTSSVLKFSRGKLDLSQLNQTNIDYFQKELSNLILGHELECEFAFWYWEKRNVGWYGIDGDKPMVLVRSKNNNVIPISKNAVFTEEDIDFSSSTQSIDTSSHTIARKSVDDFFEGTKQQSTEETKESGEKMKIEMQPVSRICSVKITKEMANYLLDDNNMADNRKPHPPTVKKYTEAMDAGRWLHPDQAINTCVIVSGSGKGNTYDDVFGKLLAGRHRLYGFQKSKLTDIVLPVMFNGTEEDRKQQDNIKARTNGDILEMFFGYKDFTKVIPSNVIVATSTILLNYAHFGKSKAKNLNASKNPEEAAFWLSKYQTVITEIDNLFDANPGARVNTIKKFSAIIAAFVIAYNNFQDKDLWRQHVAYVINPANLATGNSVRDKLIALLESDLAQRHAPERTDLLFETLSGFKMLRDNQNADLSTDRSLRNYMNI